MTEIEELKVENDRLRNELRIVEKKHQAAMRWAMTNASCLQSHLNVCRHDEIPQKKSGFSAPTLAAGNC